MFLRQIFLSCCFTFLCNIVYSQYENSFFDNDKYEQSLDSSHLQFHFDNMGYFRNVEYLSLVDKGSTYTGFQAMPYV
ncbi:MAG: hypothetical protein QMC68_02770, partial [Bacteroidia bacterium]